MTEGEIETILETFNEKNTQTPNHLKPKNEECEMRETLFEQLDEIQKRVEKDELTDRDKEFIRQVGSNGKQFLRKGVK